MYDVRECGCVSVYASMQTPPPSLIKIYIHNSWKDMEKPNLPIDERYFQKIIFYSYSIQSDIFEWVFRVRNSFSNFRRFSICSSISNKNRNVNFRITCMPQKRKQQMEYFGLNLDWHKWKMKLKKQWQSISIKCVSILCFYRKWR